MRALLAILLAAVAPAIHTTKADMQTAKASLLTKAELGKGWSGTATTQTGATFSCSGFDPSGAGITETGGANSDTFSYGSPATIFLVQSTSVYKTQKEANAYWARAVTPKLVTCAVATLKSVSAKGVKVKITSDSDVSFPTTLSRSAEYKVTGELGANKIKSYLDVVVLGDGRSITEIAVSSIESAPPLAFEQILAHDVIKNLGGSPD